MLLTKNERMSESLVVLANHSFPQLFEKKNERLAQKTDEQIPNTAYSRTATYINEG